MRQVQDAPAGEQHAEADLVVTVKPLGNLQELRVAAALDRPPQPFFSAIHPDELVDLTHRPHSSSAKCITCSLSLGARWTEGGWRCFLCKTCRAYKILRVHTCLY